MAHQRETIRAAVCAALSGHTVAGTRVFPQRFLPLRNAELPAVLVYTLSEKVTPESAAFAPRVLERDLDLIVEGLVTLTDGVDDDLDDLAESIETAMHADETFGDVCADSILEDTSIGIDADGDKLIGSVALSYRVRYQTEAPVAPTTLDDFETAGVTYKQGADQADADDAHDVVVVQVIPPEAP
jgi:hypothetical protein